MFLQALALILVAFALGLFDPIEVNDRYIYDDDEA